MVGQTTSSSWDVHQTERRGGGGGKRSSKMKGFRKHLMCQVHPSFEMLPFQGGKGSVAKGGQCRVVVLSSNVPLHKGVRTPACGIGTSRSLLLNEAVLPNA